MEEHREDGYDFEISDSEEAPLGGELESYPIYYNDQTEYVAVPISDDEMDNSEMLRAGVEKQFAALLFGKSQSTLFDVAMFLRLIPCGYSAYFNYKFSRAFNEEYFVKLKGAPEGLVTFLAILTGMVNFSIYTISTGRSINNMAVDIAFDYEPQQRPFYKSGRIQMAKILALSVLGATPSLSMVRDTMLGAQHSEFMTTAMLLSQGFTTTTLNYRGLSDHWQSNDEAMINGCKQRLIDWITEANKQYTAAGNMALDSDQLRKLEEGFLLEQSKVSWAIKGLWKFAVIPYALASFMSAFNFETCESNSRLWLGGCYFMISSIAGISMYEKYVLLNRSNEGVVDALHQAIVPSHQILPARSRGTRNERYFNTCFALFSFAIGSVTLGGAAQAVRNYVVREWIPDDQLEKQMTISYLIAWIAAVGINTKDFNDLFTVHLRNGIKWIRLKMVQDPRARERILNLHPLEIIRLVISMPLRQKMALWDFPEKPTYRTRIRTETTAALNFLGNSNHFGSFNLDNDDAPSRSSNTLGFFQDLGRGLRRRINAFRGQPDPEAVPLLSLNQNNNQRPQGGIFDL